MIFTFSVFDHKYSSWADLAQNLKLFKVKFDTKTNSNIKSSVVESILSVLDWKYPFWANLVRKIKTVSLNWKLVPRLIRIWRIQWRCSFFLFSTFSINYPFLRNFFPKIKIVCWSWNLEPILIWICRIQWWFSFFFFRSEIPLKKY